MRPVPRPLRLLSATLVTGLLAALLVVSPARATISSGTATNTSTTVTYQFSYTGSPQFLRVYVDTDRSPSTGFAQAGIGADYLLAMSADPRRWTAGATTTVSQTLTLPTNLPAGSYTLLLNLPDPLLSTRPEYSIRLADQGTWDATTGMNSLLHTLTVSGGV